MLQVRVLPEEPCICTQQRANTNGVRTLMDDHRRPSEPQSKSGPGESRPLRRADFRAPIDRFFEKQPPALRAILEELRGLIFEAAPAAQSSIKNSIQNEVTPAGRDGRVRGKDAGSARSSATCATEDDASCRSVRTRRPQLHFESSCKWGNPFFAVDGTMICALTAHKAHVNLVLAGPPDAFTDHDHGLTGASDSGRHLKLTDVSQIPRESVLDWVRTAPELAKQKRS